MGYAKALFLINYQKPQVLILYILGKKPVGADNNINQPLLKVSHGFFLLPRGSESGHQIDSDREITHSFRKSIVVLLRKDCCRHQHSDLLSVLHRFKCGSNGNFCFSESHVTAHKPVHDNRRFHITFGIIDGRQLILSFLVRKGIFKLLLPDSVLGKLKSLRLLSLGIQFYQILSHLFHCRLDLILGMTPFRCTKFIQLWLVSSLIIAASRGIFLYYPEPCGQNVKVSTVSVFYFYIIPDHLIRFNFLNSAIYPQAVVLMNHVISDFKI